MSWSWRPYQQFNRYHLCRWQNRAYRRWGSGRKHLLQQCVSALTSRKQRWQELELPRRTSNREREIQLVEPVIFERSDFEEQQENSGKQDEEEDGILEYDSPSDDDNIPSLEQVADSSPRKRFPLWKKCLLQKQNCVQLVFLYLLVMELWNYRHLLCFMHLLKLLFFSLPVPIRLSVTEV